eukprot:SAG31_NODE_30_length_32545_cov_9.378999_7_plen_106_part_00
MSLTEQQAIFSLYGLIKTPLYIGADVTTLNGPTLQVYMNKNIIAWNQDSLGKPGRQIRKAGDPNGELWYYKPAWLTCHFGCAAHGCAWLLPRSSSNARDPCRATI